MRKRRQVHGKECRKSPTDFRSDEWIDNEVVGCEFQDVRHGKRLRQLLEQLSGRVGATTPWACQDWADLVRQEFYGLMMAHFAIRGLMHEAALKADEDPDRLSFLHAVRVIRRKMAAYGAIPPSAEEGLS